MGQKLMKMYDFVGANGGLQAKMRLAVATGVPSNKAQDAPDSPELLAKFRAAVKEITGKEPPAV